MSALAGRTVLIIGRGTGIAGAIAQAVRAAGGTVIAAGRSPDALTGSYQGTSTRVERVDITDEASVADLASAVGGVDHVVSAASARARGGYADLTAPLVATSLAAVLTMSRRVTTAVEITASLRRSSRRAAVTTTGSNVCTESRVVRAVSGCCAPTCAPRGAPADRTPANAPTKTAMRNVARRLGWAPAAVTARAAPRAA